MITFGVCGFACAQGKCLLFCFRSKECKCRSGSAAKPAAAAAAVAPARSLGRSIKLVQRRVYHLEQRAYRLEICGATRALPAGRAPTAARRSAGFNQADY